MNMKDYQSKFEINGKNFIVETCTAEEQFEILMIFSKHTLYDMLKAIALTHENPEIAKRITGATLFGVLASKASKEEINYITDKLLNNLFEFGSNEPLTLEFFRNEWSLYSLCMLKCLEANFKDFSVFLNF